MSSVLPDPRVTLEALARTPRLLVALDFDGTLGYLVDNPDDARMTQSARSAVLDLTGLPGTTVALVSGRGLENLRAVSEADPRWWLVGSHGVEVEGPSNGGVVRVPTADQEQLQKLWGDFAAVASKHPGSWLEQKPWGAALHTRSLEADEQEQARTEARAVIQGWGSALTTRLGHGIIESSLQSQNKGDGIEALRAHIHPDTTVFIGDDITDEDALAVLGPGDVGVRVGGSDTITSYRLRDPDDVAAFLAELAQARVH